jgi:site-specific DNA-methyltransferase (adenine-specific)
VQSRVIKGSCFDVLPSLPKGQVQAVFVDPPYNIGFDYGSGSKADTLPPEQYLERMKTLARECVDRLTDTGSIWFLSPERWADEIGLMLKGLLPRRNRIIWRETFGQYRETVFPSGHRHLFWHVKDPKNSPFYTDEIRVVSQRMIDGDKRAAGPRVPDDVWQFPRLVGNANERIKGHPCQLPEVLLERVILSSTAPGDVLLDPMAGTGTALRVAQRLGRRYVGIEEQDSFLALINRRLGQPFQTELF